MGAVGGPGRPLDLPRAKARQTHKAGSSPADVDYYEVLQVHPTADVAVIKSAYRTIMRELQAHPDLGGDEEKATVLNEAHRVLSAPELRAECDAVRRPADKAIDNFSPGEFTMDIRGTMYAAATSVATQQAVVRNGSWGYAGLPFIYLIAHRAWLHLLANVVGFVIPVVNIGVYVWYVSNARQLVQSTRKFQSFDHYYAVKEPRDRAGNWVLCVGLLLVIVRIFHPFGFM